MENEFKMFAAALLSVSPLMALAGDFGVRVEQPAPASLPVSAVAAMPRVQSAAVPTAGVLILAAPSSTPETISASALAAPVGAAASNVIHPEVARFVAMARALAPGVRKNQTIENYFERNIEVLSEADVQELTATLETIPPARGEFSRRFGLDFMYGPQTVKLRMMTIWAKRSKRPTVAGAP